MATVAVVAITMTVAVPSFANYIESTKINAVILEMKGIEAAIDRRLSDSPDYPDSLAEVFGKVPVDPLGQRVPIFTHQRRLHKRQRQKAQRPQLGTHKYGL